MLKFIKSLNWYLVIVWVLFVPITLGAVLFSAQHTYEVLVSLTGATHYIALGAAAVIDMALILLGTLSAYYTTKRYAITQLHVATWLMIVASVSINFVYGYTSGDILGGLVSSLYPIVGALIYYFIIQLASLEARHSIGRILVEKPFLPNGVSRKTRKALKAKRAAYHVKLEEDKLDELLATTIGTWRQPEDTSLQGVSKIQATVDTSLQLQDTAGGYKPTVKDTYDYSLDTTDTDVSLQPTKEDTSLQDVVSQVETVLQGVDTSVDTPDYLDTSMTVAEMCRALVSNGVVDNPTAYRYINAMLDYDVPKKTVEGSMKRARDKAVSADMN